MQPLANSEWAFHPELRYKVGIVPSIRACFSRASCSVCHSRNRCHRVSSSSVFRISPLQFGQLPFRARWSFRHRLWKGVPHGISWISVAWFDSICFWQIAHVSLRPGTGPVCSRVPFISIFLSISIDGKELEVCKGAPSMQSLHTRLAAQN